jgi:hypothetical protein
MWSYWSGGQPGDQVAGDREAAGGQVLDGRVDVQGIEQRHGVEREAERAELVHSLAVVLAQLAALPEEDFRAMRWRASVTLSRAPISRRYPSSSETNCSRCSVLKIRP